jgi:hypothetical protein
MVSGYSLVMQQNKTIPMKLYTEEQIKKVLNPGLFYLIEPQLTPIELPSDDEMANASNHCKDGQVKIGFLRGVLWYQEQILNQNK